MHKFEITPKPFADYAEAIPPITPKPFRRLRRSHSADYAEAIPPITPKPFADYAEGVR